MSTQPTISLLYPEAFLAVLYATVKDNGTVGYDAIRNDASSDTTPPERVRDASIRMDEEGRFIFRLVSASAASAEFQIPTVDLMYRVLYSTAGKVKKTYTVDFTVQPSEATQRFAAMAAEMDIIQQQSNESYIATVIRYQQRVEEALKEVRQEEVSAELKGMEQRGAIYHAIEAVQASVDKARASVSKTNTIVTQESASATERYGFVVKAFNDGAKASKEMMSLLEHIAQSVDGMNESLKGSQVLLQTIHDQQGSPTAQQPHSAEGSSSAMYAQQAAFFTSSAPKGAQTNPRLDSLCRTVSPQAISVETTYAKTTAAQKYLVTDLRASPTYLDTHDDDIIDELLAPGKKSVFRLLPRFVFPNMIKKGGKLVETWPIFKPSVRFLWTKWELMTQDLRSQAVILNGKFAKENVGLELQEALLLRSVLCNETLTEKELFKFCLLHLLARTRDAATNVWEYRFFQLAADFNEWRAIDDFQDLLNGNGFMSLESARDEVRVKIVKRGN